MQEKVEMQNNNSEQTDMNFNIVCDKPIIVMKNLTGPRCEIGEEQARNILNLYDLKLYILRKLQMPRWTKIKHLNLIFNGKLLVDDYKTL